MSNKEIAELWAYVLALRNRIKALENQLRTNEETLNETTKIYRMPKNVVSRNKPKCKICNGSIKAGQQVISKNQRISTKFYHYNCLENSRI